MKKKKDTKIFIKHSCLTGKVVWVYRGTAEGARKAYYRACKREVRRVRQWTSAMAARRQHLMKIITGSDSGSSSSTAILKRTSGERRKAVYEILRLGKQPPPQGRAFYDHLKEEARRRNWRSGRWKENREKMIRYGMTHTPGERRQKLKDKETKNKE